jgi:hypothetical protein
VVENGFKDGLKLTRTFSLGNHYNARIEFSQAFYAERSSCEEVHYNHEERVSGRDAGPSC